MWRFVCADIGLQQQWIWKRLRCDRPYDEGGSGRDDNECGHVQTYEFLEADDVDNDHGDEHMSTAGTTVSGATAAVVAATATSTSTTTSKTVHGRISGSCHRRDCDEAGVHNLFTLLAFVAW